MKNYLVVGASSGIGKAVARGLVDSGCQVFATYNTNASDLVEGCEYQQWDALNPKELDNLPSSLDGFVYCPGRINLKPFNRLKPNSFVEDYKVQVLGAIETLQQALPALKAADNAAGLFFSTVAVQTGFNFHTQVAASKGAIEGLVRSLAAEYAPKIRFNAIAPSLTDTPLAEKLLSSTEKKEANGERHPLKRIGKVEDIAHMAMYLLDNKSSWITGQILHVDGGMSAIK